MNLGIDACGRIVTRSNRLMIHGNFADFILATKQRLRP